MKEINDFLFWNTIANYWWIIFIVLFVGPSIVRAVMVGAPTLRSASRYRGGTPLEIWFLGAIAAGIYIGYVAWIKHVDFRTFFPMIFGSVLIGNALSLLREERQIAATPISKIRSASAGLVALSGYGRTEREVIDPIWKRPCAWWRCVVQEWDTSGESGQWKDCMRRMSSESLFLEDETGRVLIKDDNETAYYGEEATLDFNSANQALLAPAFSDWGIDTSWFRGFWTLNPKKMRVITEVIRSDVPLFVFGELVKGSSFSRGGGFAQFVKEEESVSGDGSPVVRAPANEPLIISTKGQFKTSNSMSFKSFYYILAGLGCYIVSVYLCFSEGYQQPIIISVAAASFVIGLAGVKAFKNA